MKLLVKLDRISAWVLFFSLLLYFITGYGMTKGIISPSVSTSLHLSLLTYVTLVAFIMHTTYAIRLSFIRWKIWGFATKVGLILFFGTVFFFFVYVDKFYKKDLPKTTLEKDNELVNETLTQEKTFTATELLLFNGKNGQPAYTAVDNVVYDVSKVFYEGSHFSHLAGIELTNEFYSRHIESEITKYPRVGTLIP